MNNNNRISPPPEDSPEIGNAAIGGGFTATRTRSLEGLAEFVQTRTVGLQLRR